MAGLSVDRITVRTGDGRVSGAMRAKCTCGCAVWTVFQVDGMDHFHLECNGCGQSWCPSTGQCHAETARVG